MSHCDALAPVLALHSLGLHYVDHSHTVVAAMSDRGIAGRGILLDYHTWRQKHGIAHEPFKRGSIKLEHLLAVAKEQDLEIRFGDILFIRTGFTAAYNALSRDEKQALAASVPPELTGVEQSEDVLEWVWNHFSAVAGDQPAFECWRACSHCLCSSVV